MSGEIHILLVDDDENLRPVLRRMLESLGYRITEATDGTSALRILDAESGTGIGLIITDVMMPGMDGYELGREVATRRPSLPMLYMSGFSTEETFRNRVLNAATPYIAKPFDGYSLQRKIQTLLRLEPDAPPV